MLSNRKSLFAPTNNVVPSTLSGRPQSLPPRPAFSRGDEWSEQEPHCQVPSVPTSTTATLPGYRTVRLVGTVFGISTIAKKESKNFLKTAGSASEPICLTQMFYNARGQATERVTLDCVMRGGNAIAGMTCTESEVMGCMQISVSGTAVYVEKEQPFGMPPTPE